MTDAAREMTRTERNDLLGLVRRRARVAKADVKTRTAFLMQEVEEQLAAEFTLEDERWKDARDRVGAEIDALNKRVSEQLTAEGLPEEFHPEARIAWASRGISSVPVRRAEMRRLARSRIEAQEAEALAAIDRATVRTETDLIAVTSAGKAQEYLLGLPTVEQLLPQGYASRVAGELLASYHEGGDLS